MVKISTNDGQIWPLTEQTKTHNLPSDNCTNSGM